MVENIYLRDFLSNGWKFPKAIWDELDDRSRNFARFEFGGLRSKDYYKRRLKSIGFVGKENILDAGCGMGQWSIALSELNGKVFGLDISKFRVKIAKTLAATNGVDAKFCVGKLENLPFSDSFFDAIFCYGVFMFTDMPKTIKEFIRVIKPGGIIYLNANSWGWYLHLLIDRGLMKLNLGMIKSAMLFIARTFLHRNSCIVVTEKYLKGLLDSFNCKILALDVEGGIRLFGNKGLYVPPAYKSNYYGLRSIIEVVCKVDKR